MYRLASMVRLDSLRDQALRAIHRSLDAGNILQELSSPFTSNVRISLRCSGGLLTRNCPMEQTLSLICTRNLCCGTILGRLHLRICRSRARRLLRVLPVT
ncbi:uncharacterized protein BJ212DRAFT_717166 [Suillus subaureus]|uniref:Uncharacterized protein n=1 Tax=Suillus subaureus TaxID=48587 RepID=A0A9P7E104_9AGAM|nr:uncharacterized protein BJ212DRAFT_717166 [Suillus subaureus]KAG1808001.1 hypothetical protein BJ212DRAFT_717166 [Suillus subaureus]